MIAEVEKALAGGVVVVPVVQGSGSVRGRCAARAEAGERLRLGRCELRAAPRSRTARRTRDRGTAARRLHGHKRDDGLGAAEHSALSALSPRLHAFIDRFATRHGRDVQDAIADALESHAFLLLLEHLLPRVAIGLRRGRVRPSHTMGTLIVRWPNDVTPVPGSTPAAAQLATVILIMTHTATTSLRQPHSIGSSPPPRTHTPTASIRRRRMPSEASRRPLPRAAPTACVPLRDWRLLVQHPAASTLLGITPRLPTARDLQLLDAARDSTPGEPLRSARSQRPCVAK